MKTFVLILLLALGTHSMQAQKCKARDVPVAVTNAFAQAYPNIKKAYWGKDSANYQVSFFAYKAPGSITYKADGRRVISEMQLMVEDLPQPIQAYLKEKYTNEIVYDAAQVTDAQDRVTYSVQVNNMDLVFGADGHFIQSYLCYNR